MAKIYVERDTSGKITAIKDNPTPTSDQTPLFTDSPEVINFLTAQFKDESEFDHYFETSDLELVRVLEDLIDLLIKNKAIHFTDFPQVSQQKLLSRKLIREKRQNLDADILGDDDLIEL
ncbi:MAG: hypothetical protein HON68_09615 [Gammaproteobacteria bacterium]|jgi:hypothetical protein|nr:hypothetical protein [Gammaproteobacteria bacterium]MBT3488859.1 hypothetical protein [Gammaproteobacteria bacterium]MBT3719548.1 hypothetical protein [Gammaproteobacteria bacterium]MBT3844509.1 hypothetical protein [Gammaproteobacteria bacterium]MBT3891963.1 hypothetical protein [Gammaproteobacteria bacterium]